MEQISRGIHTSCSIDARGGTAKSLVSSSYGNGLGRALSLHVSENCPKIGRL